MTDLKTMDNHLLILDYAMALMGGEETKQERKELLDELLRRLNEGEADAKRLDKLEDYARKYPYGNGIVLRPSTTGRGWRLHSTSRDDAMRYSIFNTVRETIDNSNGGHE